MNIFFEYKTAQRILSDRHRVIFYAESRHYYQYFEQLLSDLLQQHIPVLYITSDKKDPLLLNTTAGMEAVYIHWWLGFLLPRIKGDVLVMTMTDLDNYAYKRSKEVGCYVYIFHAMVSTHLQYTTKAFYHYDAVFCTGLAQVEEMRATEKKYQLREKDIVAYGYPLIDVLKKVSQQKPAGKRLPVILVAPSWYNECILETCMEELIQQLSMLAYKIIIRPHPEYVKRRKKKMAALRQMANQLPTVSFDDSPEVISSLQQADILITDRSGVAFEYALGLQRPVLFVDTPLKVMNPAWQELGIEPLENRYRERMGIAIQPGDIKNIAQYITKLELLRTSFSQQAEQLERELLFNSDQSYKNGIDYIRRNVKM
jgi:CDP-glycerol glycerophosphotransferase (TagB/SpsB family)